MAGETGELQLRVLTLPCGAEKEVVLTCTGVLAKPIRLLRGDAAVEREAAWKRAGLKSDVGELRPEGSAADPHVGRRILRRGDAFQIDRSAERACAHCRRACTALHLN